MPTISSSVMLWAGCAILAFWAMGAYNRLVRLRGEATQAFAELETEMSRHVGLAREHLPAPDATQPAPLDDEGAFWAALHGAVAQFQASLNAAKARPLDPDRIAALRAAAEVLAGAWERAERDDLHDLAGPRLPEALTAQRAVISAQVFAATERFDRAVGRYNEAIAQFPAVLLAWLFGFRPGSALASQA